MDRLLQDVRFAVRSLARYPGFTTAAVLTIALGIGANTSMFGVVNGILLRPLPYAQAEQLTRLHQSSSEQSLAFGTFSVPDFEDWQQRTHSFAAMAAYLEGPQILTGRGDPVELRSAYVTQDFFRTLGSPVVLGRPLLEDDARQASRNVVISGRLWRMLFAADPAAIGSVLLLQGDPYTVVGVMPESFRFPTPDTDIWAPHALLTEAEVGPQLRDNRYLDGVARLRDGVGAGQAQAELSRVAARLAAENPATNTGWDAAIAMPLRTAIVGDVDRALLVVLAVVGFILLIGCANLANLLLARGASRSREIAIRTALGAGRTRIVRQLLTESLVLALAGGVLGLLLSIWGLQTVLALGAETLPRLEDVRIDARVVGFGLALAVVTGVLFGLLPALRAAGAAPQEQLRGGRGAVGSHGQRLRSTLVIGEVALAVVLVIGAGLMARSFLELRSVDPGFEAERVLTVGLQLNLAGVAGSEIPHHIVRRREEIIARVAALPGVTGVGMINAFPLRDEGGPLFEFTRADGTGMPDGSPLRAHARYINADYFRAMGIPLIAGDRLPDPLVLPRGAPVPVVVSETTARRYWPGEDPIGLRLDAGWAELVVTGVAGDVRQLGLAAEPPPALYLPQSIAPRLLATLAVRSAGDPLALAGPIRAVIRDVDPHQPIRSVGTLQGVMSNSIARDRFFTLLFAVFGGLALVLAAVGIYGVLAYSVGQRTREIGVRMALGASGADVLRMVVGGGMLLVGAGIGLGTIAALLLSRVLANQLYGISATDPATFAAALAFLGTVALAASFLPARRATRVDPATALRAE